MTNIFYNFHPVTFECLGEGVADESPLEAGTLLYPAHSTLKAPPATGANEAAIFSTASDSWSVVQDFRGQTMYDQVTGAAVAINELGPVAVNLGTVQPIAIVRTMAWGKIKAKRTAVEFGGVKVGTKWYHTDDASRIKYLGLFKLAEQALAAGSVGTTVLQYGGVDIRWKTMDGTFINMTVQRAQDVYFAVFGLDMAAFAAAETHKTAMEAAADPAAYDFSAGWPASYL